MPKIKKKKPSGEHFQPISTSEFYANEPMTHIQLTVYKNSTGWCMENQEEVRMEPRGPFEALATTLGICGE